jgi:hypothetical protein
MKTWTTSNGAKIKIKDMSDTHIFNTIKMLQKLAEKSRNAWLEEFDIISSYGLDEFIENQPYYGSYKSLCEEYKRRGFVLESIE